MNERQTLVVILNFHGETVLVPCLRSVLAVCGRQDQVMVIDQGGEQSLMERVRALFPQVRVTVAESNRGFAGGMNRGLRRALEEQFESVWLLNNDTLVAPGALAALQEAARARPGVQAFSPVIRTCTGTVWFAGGRINYGRMRVEHSQTVADTVNPFETQFLTGCALFLPSATLQRAGLLDERYFLYYEDAEYSRRIQSLGGALWVVPGAAVIHAEQSELNPEKTYWLVRSGVEFFGRHTPKRWRAWMGLYLAARRLKNYLEQWLRPSELARSVAKAYTDASSSLPS